ncbi:GyrI-like domain-containing protein [Aeromicrobium wangtongii]|uniref:GyrI-like domain-containing protein n=1 Tax=Aeromicrobium wangtongii TaxID=2969247 RepID=UPI0020183C02|nr:GyrI-like domain-containing protein [Aeromicrobium wangtongii]MCL3818110.1 GyrI-like domain-containing protein [Aeromicrobium wangtongii]
MADKTDFKKTLASYRAPRGRFEIVDVPALTYLMVDGRGDPNASPAFGEAIEALYPVAYGLKMTSKRELGRDYVVPPLEALWWADDMAAFTTARDKSRWSWTLLLMVPDWIGADLFAAAVQRAAAKDGRSARIDDIRWETLAEGRCVQTLHIGSFEDETPVLARMHEEFIPAHGLRMAGRHHEIYLSDFRRTEPARLRTILRQPVVDAA